MSVQYYLYSAEDFPAKRKPTRSFTDSPEWLQFNGFKIYDVKAHTWHPLPAIHRRVEYTDFTDKRGNRIVVEDSETAEAINLMMHHPESPYYLRGVKVVEREVYEDPIQREEVERQCEADNKEFRAKVISEYEMGLSERQVTGTGRGAITPYEEECYKVLGMVRPNSVEAIAAQRQPGAAMAREIVDAIRESDVQKAKVVQNLVITPEEEKAINQRLQTGAVVQDFGGNIHQLGGDEKVDVGRPTVVTGESF